MSKFLAGALALAWVATGIAADNPLPTVVEQPVHWRVELVPSGAQPGDEVEVVFEAEIASGWILYSSDFNLEIGPRPAKFAFDPSAGLTLVGAIQPVRPQWKTDRSLGGKYSYFSQHAQFRQKARLTAAAGEVSGRITGQTCFEESGLCQLFRETFKTNTNP